MYYARRSLGHLSVMACSHCRRGRDKTVLSCLDPVSNLQLSYVKSQPAPARSVIHYVVETTEKTRVFKSVAEIWSFNETDNSTAMCDVIWKLGRDKTELLP